EEAGPDTRPTQRDYATQHGRDHQAEGHPEREQVACNPETATLFEIGNVAFEMRRVRLEEPADVGVPEAPEQTEDAPAPVLGRMRVVRRVAVLMVSAVQGDPLEQR